MWKTRLTGKPLIVILGPTAVGKTALALQVAAAVSGEIVGADSRQVYRHMDIGTAKPTADERREICHHLIDVVDPDAKLSLAEYQKMAYKAIEGLHEHTRIPLLVGGTGQYISAVVEGWSIPEVPPNPGLREELEQFAERFGSESLHHRLEKLDPVAASKIAHQNIRRVVRALEVCLESGQPISELQGKHPPPYQILQIGLTMDRDALYTRADYRLQSMMQRGFLEEVSALLEMGYDRRLPAMSGLGYQQLSAHLLDDEPLEAMLEATRTATHDFIRRQYTWFRKYNANVHWYDANQIDRESVTQAIIEWLTEQA